MTGIIVELALSWLIVWLFEKGDLRVLGVFPTRERLLDFVVFFSITALCCASGFFMKMYFAGEQWRLNPDFSIDLLAAGLWWNIKSALFEELIFRGALLYVLIRKLGSSKAIVLSAISFGVYHWFSHEVFGNIPQMAATFVLTGTMGLLYAYGFAKSFSLFIPGAIHLGWNVTQGVVFSDSIIGDQLFVQLKPLPLVTVSYPVYFSILFLPMLSALLINSMLLRRRSRGVS